MRENRNVKGRNTYLCVGFSKIWRLNIHGIILKFCDSNVIKSYHGFSNLWELIQGDLVSKLRKGLAYNEFVDR